MCNDLSGLNDWLALSGQNSTLLLKLRNAENFNLPFMQHTVIFEKWIYFNFSLKTHFPCRKGNTSKIYFPSFCRWAF